MSGTQTEITRDANKRKYYSIKSRPRSLKGVMLLWKSREEKAFHRRDNRQLRKLPRGQGRLKTVAGSSVGEMSRSW